MSKLDAAAEVIKKFEGCRLKAYQDQGGIWTVGFGQTGPNIGPATVWTQAQADAALVHFLESLDRVVMDLVKVPINENQYVALMSFAYNVGTAALARSSVLRLLNQGDYSGAADCFRSWVKVKGRTNQGLVNRREAERALFLKAPPEA